MAILQRSRATDGHKIKTDGVVFLRRSVLFTFRGYLFVICITVKNVRDEIPWNNAFILGWAGDGNGKNVKKCPLKKVESPVARIGSITKTDY